MINWYKLVDVTFILPMNFISLANYVSIDSGRNYLVDKESTKDIENFKF